jgi:CheY-like chemotaxis protein
MVDDESDSRELLVAGLQRRGYRAEGAVDGATAAARLNENWAAIVADLHMPGVDGPRLLKLAFNQNASAAVGSLLVELELLDRSRIESGGGRRSHALIQECRHECFI